MTEELSVATEVATDDVVADAAHEVTTDESQDVTEETQSDGAEVTPDTDDKPKSRHQKRKAAMQAARERADKAERDLQEHKDALSKAKEAAQSGVAPKESDFGTYEEYLVAQGAFTATRALDEREARNMETQEGVRQREAEQAKQQHQAEIQASWNEQVAEIRQTHPDFEKVAYSAPIPDDLALTIAQMDRGAEIAYSLGLDHGKAGYLASLPPIERAMELGRMEAVLSAPKPRNKTTAPDPLNPVGSKAAVSKDPASMSMAEYRAWREAGGTS